MDDHGVRLRRGTTEDAAAVTTLNAHVQRLHLQVAPGQFAPIDEVAPHDFFAERLASGDDLFWIAEMDSRTVGYLYAVEVHREANPFTTEQHTLYIHHLAVDPTLRRRGVGSALFAAAEEYATTHHLSGLRLDSWLFNEAAHAFFRRQGFEPFLARFARDL
ncbi:GNAT family N-acetyltransferase [Kineococcus sp. SYSU DK001]|uniref:GNAT family N-acetyltransferase n=1 Tax=Kineococcus sp. SYSU DK001 TaxID=3383122 RepID=UPI003D7D92E0